MLLLNLFTIWPSYENHKSAPLFKFPKHNQRQDHNIHVRAITRYKPWSNHLYVKNQNPTINFTNLSNYCKYTIIKKTLKYHQPPDIHLLSTITFFLSFFSLLAQIGSIFSKQLLNNEPVFSDLWKIGITLKKLNQRDFNKFKFLHMNQRLIIERGFLKDNRRQVAASYFADLHTYK